jgi:rhodanese-related sulfurtransferase
MTPRLSARPRPSLLALAAFTTIAACTAPSAAPPAPHDAAPAAAPAKSEVRTVDVAGLAAARDAGKVPILVDVRTPGEFAGGHVPGAVNIPIDALPSRLAELEPHRQGDVYVICEVGGRSAAASRQLAAAGFQPIDVRGGTSAWRAAGQPVE